MILIICLHSLISHEPNTILPPTPCVCSGKDQSYKNVIFLQKPCFLFFVSLSEYCHIVLSVLSVVQHSGMLNHLSMLRQRLVLTMSYFFRKLVHRYGSIGTVFCYCEFPCTPTKYITLWNVEPLFHPFMDVNNS